mmetsp:Transcript_78917/g.96481  ORF Transcript_78917/g.96481 Transcript_78917/m.96481 type:complete len:291 (-) Transcript_78917:34-906(-)
MEKEESLAFMVDFDRYIDIENVLQVHLKIFYDNELSIKTNLCQMRYLTQEFKKWKLVWNIEESKDDDNVIENIEMDDTKYVNVKNMNCIVWLKISFFDGIKWLPLSNKKTVYLDRMGFKNNVNDNKLSIEWKPTKNKQPNEYTYFFLSKSFKGMKHAFTFKVNPVPKDLSSIIFFIYDASNNEYKDNETLMYGFNLKPEFIMKYNGNENRNNCIVTSNRKLKVTNYPKLKEMSIFVDLLTYHIQCKQYFDYKRNSTKFYKINPKNYKIGVGIKNKCKSTKVELYRYDDSF